MKPASSRAKGRRGQQLVRDLILQTFPSLEPDDVRSTAMGQNGSDIQLSPAARKLFPYEVEVKTKARSQIHTYMEQAKTHGTNTPIVFVKQDRKELLAIVNAEHFLELLKQLNENQNQNPES